MPIATLSIDLEARLANLQQGMDKAGRLAEKQSQQIESSFNGMKTAAAGVGAALAASLSVAGIVTFVRATIDGVDRLNDLADATGASIENLSALEDIAVRTGTSMDTVGDAVVKLNKFLGEAGKPGGEAANALKAIGLNAAELKRLDPAEALRQVAVALSGYADDGNKARLVQELFGKSIQEVAPLLKDLAAAGKLNATVTTEQAQAAERFNLQLFALQKNATDASRQITGPLVSALNNFLEKARDASDTSKGLQERLALLFGAAKSLGAGALIGLSSEDTDRLAEARTELAAIEQALKRADISAARRADLENKRIGRLSTIAKLQADGASSFRPSQNYGDGFRPSLPAVAADKPKPRGAADITRTLAPAGLSPAALDALKAIDGTDEAKVRSLNAALDELFAIRAGGAGSGPDVDAAIAKLRDELEKLSPAAQEAAKAKQRLDAILSNTPTARMISVCSLRVGMTRS